MSGSGSPRHPGAPEEHATGTLACLAFSPAKATSLEELNALTDRFSECTSQLYRYQVWWMLGGTAALLLAAVAIMVATPLWMTRRRKLQPLTVEDAPAVVEEVAELAREQELDPPRLFWNPLDASAGGLAFGHPGRYSVAIGGGLVVKQAVDPPAFRAVVRHELAHLRNRDVGITYFTLSVWYAFILVAVIPFLVTLLGEDLLSNVMWRLAVLALLVYLTRNAVLRSREVYADLRASVPDGPDGALRRVLAALPRPKTDPLTRVRSPHPDPARRLAALDDTRPLFPLGAVVAFAAGLTATIAFDSVKQLLSSFVSDPFDLFFLAGLVLVPLAAGTVGVAIWREAFAAHADGRKPASPWVDALALAAGFALGPELALDRIVTPEGTLVRELDSIDGLVWAGGARRRARAHRRLDPDERLLVASSARRPPAGARADGGPARRRHRAHRVHGHLLDRPRAAAQPRRSRAPRRPPSTSRSTRRSGPFRSASGSSSWTASCS